MNIGIIFLFIAVLFFVLLSLKSILKKDFCVICASIALIWVGMLTARYLGHAVDPIFLAILMGGSAVGIYFWIDSRISDKFGIFRLPILLSLFLIVLLLMNPAAVFQSALLVVSGLWILFGLIYLFRASPATAGLVKKIIECCKNW